jgi:hypothetical protein
LTGAAERIPGHLMTKMKKLIPVALVVAGALVSLRAQAQSPTCTKETWRALAELYARAACYPDQFPDFVAGAKAKYPPGGAWRTCGERLGKALMETGASVGDRREIEERAYSVAARAGAPEFGGPVADSMARSADSPALMGLYLLTVIRSAAEIQAGNPGFYTSTDYFRLTSQAWQLAAYAMGPEQMENFRKVVYEASVAILVDLWEKAGR